MNSLIIELMSSNRTILFIDLKTSKTNVLLNSCYLWCVSTRVGNYNFLVNKYPKCEVKCTQTKLPSAVHEFWTFKKTTCRVKDDMNWIQWSRVPTIVKLFTPQNCGTMEKCNFNVIMFRKSNAKLLGNYTFLWIWILQNDRV